MPGGSAGALPYHALSPGASSDEGPENRAHVRIFSWFGLVLGALHMLGGSALGLLQVAISCVGLYATWSDTRSRLRCVAAFAAGWAVWAVFETSYLVLVLAALSATASDFVASLVASTTFPDVAPHVRSLFAAVRKDVGVFVVFSAFTAVLFDVCRPLARCAIARYLTPLIVICCILTPQHTCFCLSVLTRNLASFHLSSRLRPTLASPSGQN
jgi:hypothetical protein